MANSELEPAIRRDDVPSLKQWRGADLNLRGQSGETVYEWAQLADDTSEMAGFIEALRRKQ